MKKILLSGLFTLVFFSVFSQNRYWSAHRAEDRSIITDKAVSRMAFPKAFRLFDLNIADLQRDLFSITIKNASAKSVVISLPNADGAIEDFEVFEASNFEPALQERFPEIRGYSGKGITDKYATLKLSIAPDGIQTMIFRTDKQTEFIEPYSGDHKIYSVFRSQRNKTQLPWSCSTQDRNTAVEISGKIYNINSPASSAGQLKTMRLAQSCNGEYANYFGATSSADVAKVLAAFNATISRCNGVFEKDLGVHLNLIAQTTDVIYYTPSTDPYTTLSNWNLQLQQTLTSVIGSANYDIGHMFGASGGGGNAGCIGCVCVDPANNTSKAKGSGITSPADGIPKGDNFDIDYVVHEMGHQLGANHTFSNSNEGTGVNVEIGSGITIMGYAGITSYDLAPHSIDIFHAVSITQIQTNLAGKSCPVTTNISGQNHTPVVAAVANKTIPISTPFALTGSATDADNDPLTYCWEQVDDGGSNTGANSNASATKTTGPNWISWVPTSSPIRLFPKLATILTGGTTTKATGNDAAMLSEALSSVSRTLNFRLTVRDNSPYVSSAPVSVGQTAYTNMAVTVTNTSGPFTVTSPNTNVSYPGGSTQTVTWNVANTTAAPVSCANVNILYSTDGGNTFPYTLVANTPNDGSQSVVIPVGTTTTARIKVEAVGNIFFDISNSNFTVTTPLPVNFLSFNAVKDRGVVRLNWQTANEMNVRHYSIERSTDGVNFSGIDKKAATGNGSTANNSYMCIDLNAVAGKNYYRLAEVDNDGRIIYSETRLINFDRANVPVVSQPNSSIIYVDVPSISKPYSVRLYNAAGQEVLTVKNISDMHTSVNIETLAKGMYVADVYYNSDIYHFKVLK